jgi:iron complex outermembrane receptor protein
MASPIAVSQDFRKITKKGRLAVKYLTGFGAIDENEIEISAFGGAKEFTNVNNLNYIVSTRYSLGTLTRYTNRGHIMGLTNTFTTGFDFAYQTGPVNAFENIAGNRGPTVETSYDASVSSVGFYFLNHLDFFEGRLGTFLSGRYDISSFGRDMFIPYGKTDSTRVFTGFTPKLGLNFKIFDDIALYTSYGLSLDFPALSELDNNLTTSNIAYTLNPDLDPQKSQNFELGVKGNILRPHADFMQRVVFDVTYFHYLLTDEIVPYVINQQIYFKNAAKTRRDGIEIGLQTKPFDETELTVNYTITNFKYTSYKTVNPTATGDTSVDYSGNFEPSVPEQIVNFILNYEFEISEEYSGLLQWDCDYIGKLYVNDENSAAAPAYFYGNIMGGLTYRSEIFSVVLYAGVYNIFDKKYIGFVNTNDFQGRYFESGEPRNIYSGLNVRMNL